MITIDGSFLTSLGVEVQSTGNANSQYSFHNGIVVNGVTCYNQKMFFQNATVGGVNYQDQYGFYKAIGAFHSEPIYDQVSYMQNTSFDGVNPISSQYNYYKNVGKLILFDALNITGLQLYLNKNTNVNTKIAASFVSANSEYLSSTSADFNVGDEDISFGVWVKVDNTNTQRLFGRYTSVGNRSYIIYKDGSNFNFQTSNDGTSTTTVTSPITYSINTWYFIVVIHDSVNDLQKISINGGAFTSVSNNLGIFSGGTSKLEISNSDLIPLNGQIDAPFFYKKALSLSEVTALYNSGNGTDYNDLTTSQKTSLVDWWLLNEESGNRQGELGHTFTDNNTVGYTIGKVQEQSVIGQKVFNWIDQSTNSYIFKQDILTRQTILQNDNIYFDGVDDFLEYTAIQPLNDTSGILFFSFISDGVNFTNILTSTNAVSNNLFIAFQETVGFVVRIILNNATVTNSITSTDTTVVGYNYGYISSDGSSYSMSLNGVIQTPVVVIGSNDGKWFSNVPNRNNVVIASGQRLTSFYSISRINKLIYSNATLSTAEKLDIDNFMSNSNN